MNGMIHRFVQVNTAFDYDTSRHDALSPSFYRSQLDSMQALFDEELEFNEESSAWSLDMQIAIDDEKERFATLILSSYAYTGGAHGNWGTSFIHIDRKSGKELSLEDFFVDINQLNDIAEPFFRKEYDLSPEEDLEQAGYWFEDAVFSVNNNFAFEGKDLVFLYGLYEIAPYASGTLELRIPLKEVEHLVLIPVH